MDQCDHIIILPASCTQMVWDIPIPYLTSAPDLPTHAFLLATSQPGSGPWLNAFPGGLSMDNDSYGTQSWHSLLSHPQHWSTGHPL